MKTFLIVIIALCSAPSSFGQASNANVFNGLTFDSTIRTEVDKNITKSEFDEDKYKLLIYNNRMLADLYEDDKLKMSTNDKNISQLFKSFYYWRGDTLNIDGAFGLFGGTGFTIKVIKGKATLYHILASDEFPAYSYTANDNLISRLEVPCIETKIILSELPDSTRNQIIYGYVEFKSGEYFSSSGSHNGKEILPRQKNRANMKMYFKSGRSPF